MTIVEELFQEVNVVSTREVAAAFEISEADARDWADELGVPKIGASFVWTKPDVEALEEARDAEEEEEGEDNDADEEPDDDDQEDDDDEDEDDDQEDE
jgi:hypothetical protein